MAKELLFWRGHRRAYTCKADGDNYGLRFYGSPPRAPVLAMDMVFATIEGARPGAKLPWVVKFPKRKDEAKIPTVWVESSEDGRRHIEAVAALQGIEVRS